VSTPAPAKVAELMALARGKGCRDLTWVVVDGKEMALSLTWKGKPYELTFDISNAIPAVVDRQLLLMREAVLQLTSGRQEAQP
jgi:hypothetical protein